MSSDNLSRAKFIITGLVQGVGYRYFVYDSARPLGVKGYAKNLADGRVEVVAEGPKESLEQLRDTLSRGPSHAHVDHVKAEYGQYRNEFSGFDIY
jgi:acylphosphatase